MLCLNVQKMDRLDSKIPLIGTIKGENTHEIHCVQTRIDEIHKTEVNETFGFMTVTVVLYDFPYFPFFM